MVVRSWSELDFDNVCSNAKVFGFDLDNTLASLKTADEARDDRTVLCVARPYGGGPDLRGRHGGGHPRRCWMYSP